MWGSLLTPNKPRHRAFHLHSPPSQPLPKEGSTLSLPQPAKVPCRGVQWELRSQLQSQASCRKVALCSPNLNHNLFCPRMISPKFALQNKTSILNEYCRSFCSLKIISDISLLAKCIKYRQGRRGIQIWGRELPQSSIGELLLSLAWVLWLEITNYFKL